MTKIDKLPQLPWRRCVLGMGGNIGDVLASMRMALAILASNDGIEIGRCSSLYETPPWGLEDQPVFLNSCVEISTNHEPESLLEVCQEAEQALKRERNVKWGPRTIDIDILLLEEGGYYSEKLEAPHPRIRERAFVLVPLAEIVGEWILDNNTVGNWLYSCDTSGIEKVAECDVFDDLPELTEIQS